MVQIDHLSGYTLGQYQLMEMFGQGGMGAVYRAYQKTLNREVAVKLLYAQGADLQRFIREAQTAATLEHPHIVAVHDFGTHQMEDGTELPFLVMRLLTGGSLGDRIKQRTEREEPLPTLTEAAELLMQIASALAYAHQRGVIHRDIKPNNIMFDAHDNAYVVDFGIAKLTNSATITDTNMTLGTPAFMPPEQWRGETLTPAADQYALAIVAYLVLTGNLPFRGDTNYVMMYSHLNDAPTSSQKYRTDISPQVAQVLERALAKTPEERYASVLDFARAFKAAVTGQDDIKTGQRSVMPNVATMQTPRPISTSQPKIDAPTAVLHSPTQSRLLIAVGLGVVFIGVAAAVIATQTQDNAVSTPTLSPTAANIATRTPEASFDVGDLGELSTAIARNPDQATNYVVRGNTYLASGNCRSAIADYDQAISIGGAHPTVHLARAHCYVGMSDKASAAQDAVDYMNLTTSTEEAISVTSGESVSVEIVPGVRYRVTFDGTQGQQLTATAISTTSGTVDPVIVLLSPEGEALIYSDDTNVGASHLNAAIDEYALAADGKYSLLVAKAGGGGTGTVEVTITLN